MTKELRKTIMNRSKLRNKFLKTRNEESRRRFNHQRNVCVSLLRKTKRLFFGTLNHKGLSDNSRFGKLFVLSFLRRIFAKNPLF